MPDPQSKHGEKKLVTIKNTADLQRLKIEKLMKNPDKPALIPEPPKQKAIAPPPDFVRNVMGSSAGAGSGEFHVYRHLRRKEYSRQKFIQEKSEKEKLDEEYHRQIEENKKAAANKTAKKRAKRLRKKRNARLKRKQPKININQQNVSSQSDTNSEGSEEEEDNEKSKDLTSMQSTLEDAEQGDNNSRNDEKALSENENPNTKASEKPVDDSESLVTKCNENISLDLHEGQNENS